MRDVTEMRLTRVKAHLSLEPALSLIGCGRAGSPGSAGGIAQSIVSHGRSIGELSEVVITHGHPDHAGSARELVLAGVPIDLRSAPRSVRRSAFCRPASAARCSPHEQFWHLAGQLSFEPCRRGQGEPWFVLSQRPRNAQDALDGALSGPKRGSITWILFMA